MVIYCMQGRFGSTFEEVDRQIQRIMSRLTARDLQYTAEFLFRLDFVLRELFNNAIEHGNRMEPSKWVWYTLRIDGTDVELCVGDEGEDFDIEGEIHQEYQSDIFRVRKRGLATIVAMGFEITRRAGWTCVRLTGESDETDEKRGIQDEYKLS